MTDHSQSSRRNFLKLAAAAGTSSYLLGAQRMVTSIVSSLIALGVIYLVPAVADAAEESFELDPFTNATDSIGEIHSVSQLSDVQSGDWALQALQSLAERYGCIADYPDQIFRGNHAITRYEFAAGLSVCLNHISELMTAESTNLVTESDLETLQKLQAEFVIELALLQGRMNTLETRTTQLETTQFSTTTKLSGEVIYGLTSSFGSEKAASSDQADPLDESVILSDRIRLRLNTSFTGTDLLRIQLQAGNTPSLGQTTGTNMARLGFDGNNANQFEVNQLFYRFPIGQSAEITILASGALFHVADTLNPFLGSDSVGSPFLFGVRSPIYREEIGGTGAGISYDLNPVLNLTLVYLAIDANLPASGLLKDSFSALGQLTWKPNDRVNIGLLYSRSYNGIAINAGSNNANTPFGNASQSVSANSYGLVGSVRINPNFAIGGWTGFVQATANDLPSNPTADIFYYAVTLTFPDLGKKGNLAGLAFGHPPKLVRNEFGPDDPNTSFNIQASYRFQINDYISITPGLLVITNPEHDRDNHTLYIGTIRTTFMF